MLGRTWSLVSFSPCLVRPRRKLYCSTKRSTNFCLLKKDQSRGLEYFSLGKEVTIDSSREATARHPSPHFQSFRFDNLHHPIARNCCPPDVNTNERKKISQWKTLSLKHFDTDLTYFHLFRRRRRR